MLDGDKVARSFPQENNAQRWREGSCYYSEFHAPWCNHQVTQRKHTTLGNIYTWGQDKALNAGVS